MDGKVHIMLLPFLGHGHLIPMTDMATLFCEEGGVRVTIVTTPLNVPNVVAQHKDIEILTLKFPCAEAGLPEGCENTDSIPSPAHVLAFFKATTMLQSPFEHLLLQHPHPPHCLIASAFFPWASHSAAKFKIPRLVFHGTGAFALCASECVRLHRPHRNISSDSEPFLIPHLPGDIKLTKMMLPDYEKAEGENDFTRALKEIKESEVTSLGVVVNSFYELEQVYADYYTNVLGRRAWLIGPLSLRKGKRSGKQPSIDEGEILRWLDSKEPNSVVYVCFGSIANFTGSQLGEIAAGLEASGKHFIWVVRRSEKEFERTTDGKGIIIRGWAPQVLILEHQAVGCFVTHCGWNSTLEAVSAGVPMVTWPVSAEQFYNEKLVTEILETGVPVGVKKWGRIVGDDSVTSEAIEKAVKRVMEGEEAEGMRNRAWKLSQMAKTAVEHEGSSHSHLTDLIQYLRASNSIS
ncbi:hypothetical protein RJT34_05006 [Clitoria ternatea]|uniref:Glycosyltransferase n=1 Tax=Clitoria ternatea TaxID=43366 RepID=A0AAN9PQZ7_CLITE